MVSVRSNIRIPDKYKKNGVNITECMNELKTRVLTNACILKGIVKDTSIGPTSSNSSWVDSVSPVRSPPPSESNESQFEDESIKADVTDNRNARNNSESIHENGDLSKEESSEIRLEKKKKNRFDKEQREYINEIIREKVMQVREEELRLEVKLNDIREESRLARARLDYKREQALLQEEVDMANKAEQWTNMNKQLNSKRLIESNERLKKALERQSEAEERHKRELKEKRMRLDKIHNYQLQFTNCYQQLQAIAKKCKNTKELLGAMINETTTLKMMNEKFISLIEKCKKYNVTNKDVEEAINILKETEDILKLFDKEAEIINTRLENAEKEKEEQRNVENRLTEAGVNGNETVPATNKRTDGAVDNAANVGNDSLANLSELEDCVDKESHATYMRLKTFLDDYEASLQPLLKDDKMKKFRFSCQKTINTPVNAISPLSREHMQDKLNRLSRLLKGQPVPSGDVQFTASNHPLGIKYCTYLLAKTFVSQGEHAVSSKPEAAFAIAGIMISLWQEFSDFGTLLMAQFQKECPYLIPVFMPQLEGQTNEEYYKILGYRYKEGKVEPQDKFLKRMSGIIRLYSAMLVTQQHGCNVPHPLGLQEGWRWLAAILNLDPRADISATLILDMLDVAGSELIRCYGTQFQKLLHLLCTDYFPRIEKMMPDGCEGPVRRLKTFLEKILKEGKIPPPVGLLPASIW